jgi:hypothetical protein
MRKTLFFSAVNCVVLVIYGTASKNKICSVDSTCKGNIINSLMICSEPVQNNYVGNGTKICRCLTPGMGGIYCNISCSGSANNPCNGHGECSFLTGACSCDNGWGGPNCSNSCPQENGLICNGVGSCSLDGICQCETGYRGFDCGIECSGGGQTPCSGHGTCLEDGTCLCASAWRGSDCSVPCPGFVGYQGATVCNGHGKCSDSALCECDTIWRGSACELRLSCSVRAAIADALI